MKAYVSVDLEGLPGVASLTMLSPKNPQYSIASRIMTKLSVAIARELLNRGFKEVAVADSHGYMTNLNYLAFPRGVRLIQGYPRPISMVAGICSEYKAAFFVGYHCGAGTIRGILDHTYSGRTFYRVWLNGVPVSEFLLNSLVVGEHDVPVVMVAGDCCLRSEVEKYSPWTIFIELKQGMSRYAAIYKSIEEVIDEIKTKVGEAVRLVEEGVAKPLKFNYDKYRLRIEFRESEVADIAETTPGASRIDAYTVDYYLNTPSEVLKLIELLALAGSGLQYLKQLMQ
ncbi:MAG: M55 family metallopeptidase [Sulfolobales archaeon]|nr:M55 family metallopeptidase [Sulfolobales archaeon]MCX8199150.1 M55 family metallopeptidase [Sulfolobales archaeon]MDW8170130.1 M55 family metallopeptidase [Desulfurococcaceae archaeon]